MRLLRLVLLVSALVMLLTLFNAYRSTAIDDKTTTGGLSQGQCIDRLLSKCPVCNATREDECDSTARMEYCDPLTETCATTRMRSLRGNVEQVIKGCVAISQCNGKTSCSNADKNTRRRCVTCFNDEDESCRNIGTKLRNITFLAVSSILFAVFIYAAYVRRRRDCHDNCLALCSELQRHSCSHHASTSKWLDLPTHYRYATLS